VCWHGGGVPNNYYFTTLWTEDAFNVQSTPWVHDDFGSGPTAGATVIAPGTWYRIRMTRSGATLTLETMLEDFTPVGTVTCPVPGWMKPFQYVWIGKNDTGDWPWMDGYMDDISITTMP
jgi:hypothetical protein